MPTELSVGLTEPDHQQGIGVVAPFDFALDRAEHLVLPVATLTITGIGYIFMYTRSSMLNVLTSEPVQHAHARGIPRGRLVRRHRDGKVTLLSRNENDVTVSFPELFGLASLNRDLLLDGEIVALADGIPTFAALADRMHVRNARKAQALVLSNPVTLIVFDVLRLDGEDLTGEPS